MEQIITVTDKALHHIREIYQKEQKGLDTGLRLGVSGGGCSGLSYKIEFSEKKEKDNNYFVWGTLIIMGVLIGCAVLLWALFN